MPDDPELYDLGRPFDADKLMGGFTVEECQVPIDPDSSLGWAMAEARAAWSRPGCVPIDTETWWVEPIPVELDSE